MDTLMTGENNNVSYNFGLDKNEKSTFEEQNIEDDYSNLACESLDNRNHARVDLLKPTL